MLTYTMYINGIPTEVVYVVSQRSGNIYMLPKSDVDASGKYPKPGVPLYKNGVLYTQGNGTTYQVLPNLLEVSAEDYPYSRIVATKDVQQFQLEGGNWSAFVRVGAPAIREESRTPTVIHGDPNNPDATVRRFTKIIGVPPDQYDSLYLNAFVQPQHQPQQQQQQPPPPQQQQPQQPQAPELFRYGKIMINTSPGSGKIVAIQRNKNLVLQGGTGEQFIGTDNHGNICVPGENGNPVIWDDRGPAVKMPVQHEDGSVSYANDIKNVARYEQKQDDLALYLGADTAEEIKARLKKAFPNSYTAPLEFWVQGSRDPLDSPIVFVKLPSKDNPNIWNWESCYNKSVKDMMALADPFVSTRDLNNQPLLAVAKDFSNVETAQFIIEFAKLENSNFYQQPKEKQRELLVIALRDMSDIFVKKFQSAIANGENTDKFFDPTKDEGKLRDKIIYYSNYIRDNYSEFSTSKSSRNTGHFNFCPDYMPFDGLNGFIPGYCYYTDSNGNPVYKGKDANSNTVYQDLKGNLVYEIDWNGNKVYRDSKGNLVAPPKEQYKDGYFRFYNPLNKTFVEFSQKELNEFQQNYGTLNNIGATCYMNAGLRAYFMNPVFRLYLKKLNVQKMGCVIDHMGKQTHHNMLKAMALLEKQLEYETERKNIAPGSGVSGGITTSNYSPYAFKEALGAENDLFQGVAANDTKDLINFLNERFDSESAESHPGVRTGNVSNQTQPDQTQPDQTNLKEMARGSYQEQFLERSSPMRSIFYGTQNSTSTCCGCGITRHNLQVYNFLEFPLEPVDRYRIQRELGKWQATCTDAFLKGDQQQMQYAAGMLTCYQRLLFSSPQQISGAMPPATIDDLFGYFQKTDLMTGDNQMYCNICRRNESAYYKTELYFETLPSVLNMPLNRGRGATYEGLLDLPDAFTVQADDRSGRKRHYVLMVIAAHLGESSMSGHFIAYGRDVKNGTGVLTYNDAFLSRDPKDPNKIAMQGLRYLPFYMEVGEAEYDDFQRRALQNPANQGEVLSTATVNLQSLRNYGMYQYQLSDNPPLDLTTMIPGHQVRSQKALNKLSDLRNHPQGYQVQQVVNQNNNFNNQLNWNNNGNFNNNFVNNNVNNNFVNNNQNVPFNQNNNFNNFNNFNNNNGNNNQFNNQNVPFNNGNNNNFNFNNNFVNNNFNNFNGNFNNLLHRNN